MRVETIILSVMMLLFLPHASGADIYKYVDGDGVAHFTNVGGGKKYRKIASEPKRGASRSGVSRKAAGNTGASSSSYYDSSYSDIIRDACSLHGVDPALVHAIVKVESDFNAFALSRKGAMGLMQLMPQTAIELNVKNSFNPVENIHGGVKYLRYLLDRYEGNLRLALAAYNSGETSVKRWGTIPPFRETQQYVEKVLALYNGKMSTAPSPRYTIYVGYGKDGTLLLTDNPSSHPAKKFTRTPRKSL